MQAYQIKKPSRFRKACLLFEMKLLKTRNIGASYTEGRVCLNCRRRITNSFIILKMILAQILTLSRNLWNIRNEIKNNLRFLRRTECVKGKYIADLIS